MHTGKIEKVPVIPVAFIWCILVVSSQPSNADAVEYPARLQPEFDSIDVDSYLSNERRFNLQIQCLLFEGPCDSIGRWLKPRVAPALLGECLKCTPTQTKNMDKILTFIQDKRPDLYRAAVTKYVQDFGLTVSLEDKKALDVTRDHIKNSSRI